MIVVDSELSGKSDAKERRKRCDVEPRAISYRQLDLSAARDESLGPVSRDLLQLKS